MQDNNVLEVRNLNVAFQTSAGMLPVVRDVSFEVARGETLALVGESGSGKSVTSLGILRLTPPAPGCSLTGEVWLRDRDGGQRNLLTLTDHQMRDVRGRDAAMVFQEPMTSFNPLHTIGRQIAEGVRWHEGVNEKVGRDRATELLDLVGIPDARARLDAYPHHLSGGMRQRAMIAMALSCNPSLLIADEPTTALDVTIQAQILELLQRLQQRNGMSMVFITHNLGVVAEIADRVVVMYGGRIVEQADVVPLFKAPRMPYTMGLLDSVPRLDHAGKRRGALRAIPGNVPDPYDPPPGCSFAPRCAHVVPAICNVAVPALSALPDRHLVRCARWQDVPAREEA
jgi:oligopeptide transport system ATP-binding protein